jgi:hypothetical protein
VEVTYQIDDVRRSLQFLSENGTEAGGKAAKAAARIFARTQDVETRRLCLNTLYKITDKTAKNELLHIYRQEPNADFRPAIAEHLRQALRDDKNLSRTDARAVLNVIGQP